MSGEVFINGVHVGKASNIELNCDRVIQSEFVDVGQFKSMVVIAPMHITYVSTAWGKLIRVAHEAIRRYKLARLN